MPLSSLVKKNTPEESVKNASAEPADPAKNATADILVFSLKRPLWQQDALRRLTTKSSLSSQDLEELLIAAKIEAGSLPADPKLNLLPLAEGNLTSVTVGQTPIRLKSLGATENANQLKPGETLEFGHTGLTLIYGDNGSGKSGYTRIFKSASAARGVEDILPDVFDAGYASKPPAKAIFTVITKNDDKQAEVSIPWEDKKLPAELLRQVRVFDRKAAVLYVKDKTDIEFIPFNLDLLDRLGSLCVKLKEMLKVELDKFDGERRAQLATIPLGAVRAAAEVISHSTTSAEIEVMCKWDDKDSQRLSELQLLLENAEKTIKALRAQKSRIDALHSKLIAIDAALTDEAVSKAIELFKNRIDLKAVAEATRNATFGKELKLLPGVGGTVWKALWEAARRYSIQEAYPGKPFPVTNTDTDQAPQCVLCQQDLTPETKIRLDSFEKFVSGDLEKQANTAEKMHDDLIASLEKINVSASAEDQFTISEIEEVDPSVAVNLRSLFIEVQNRKDSMVEVARSGNAANLKPRPIFHLDAVKAIGDALATKLLETQAAMTPQRHQEFEKERTALLNRKSLSDHKAGLLALTDNRKSFKRLDSCNPQFETFGISMEMTALNKKYVNAQFEKCLFDELEAIGVRRRVTVQVGTQKASSFIKPKFDGSAFTELERVLSEGEHRAVALACFLAETQMTGTKHTIVIDDPVSSLDHERRHLVAKRLVQEAKQRQVIIFTHDMVFWSEIFEACEDLSVHLTPKDLIRDGRVCGIVGQGTQPWHNLDVNLRLNHIQELLPSMEALYTANSPEYAEKARSAAVKLRDVWERMIEESLFNKALLRFRKSVNTKSLATVSVEFSDYEVIEHGMTRTSNWCHDRSRAQGNAAPIPKEIKDEIAQIQAFQTVLKKRRSTIEKQRKVEDQPA